MGKVRRMSAYESRNIILVLLDTAAYALVCSRIIFLLPILLLRCLFLSTNTDSIAESLHLSSSAYVAMFHVVLPVVLIVLGAVLVKVTDKSPNPTAKKIKYAYALIGLVLAVFNAATTILAPGKGSFLMLVLTLIFELMPLIWTLLYIPSELKSRRI